MFSIEWIDDICNDNLRVLKLTTMLFFVFTLAELAGGYISNSLSLLDDAYAMSLDIITYILNLYAEDVKISNRTVTVLEAFVINSLIPLVSIIALLILCTKIMLESITIVKNPPQVNDVDVSYMYVFSLTNFVIDVIVVGAFIYRGKDIFYEKVMDFKHLRINPNNYSSSNSNSKCNSDSSEGGGKHYPAVEMQSNSNSNDDGHHMNKLGEDSPLLPLVITDDSNNSSSSNGNKSMNMVMMTAFSHVGSDSLRTLAVFAASLVSTITGVDPDICDAWSALVSCIGIILGSLYVLVEVGKRIVVELKELIGSYSDSDKSEMDNESTPIDDLEKSLSI